MLSMGAHAQMQDVTSQYIPNAGFEECDALPTVVYHDNQKNIDIDKVELYQESSVAKGYDYEAQGWKLVEQQTAVNGGVVIYNCNIQTGKWATAGEPGPAAGVTGEKGLCFVGNKGLVYQQANEITLPAGVYRFTVNLYARNGQTTNPGATQQVVNVKTGFMPTGGNEESLIPAIRKSMQFASNAWDQEVLDIELTEATTGRFQISYGSSYYVIVDDVKLEYQGGVVTTALQNVITKAQALNFELSNSDLATAIAIAQGFIAEPTTQEDVTVQVEALYTAMANALTASTDPVNITAAYLENASFETGKINPWEWGSVTGGVGSPINAESEVYLDGNKMVEFTSSGSNLLTQTVTHLPAGYYIIDAKLNQNAVLKLGTQETSCTGGTDALYLRVHSKAMNVAAPTDLIVGARSTKAFRIDNFRLFYGKDEASLLAAILPAVKSDAQSVIGMSQFDCITGDERTALQTAINGTDIDAINTALNAFVSAKSAYENLNKAKNSSLDYTKEAYPYGSDDIFQQIQKILATDATSATDATGMTTQLETLCFNFYVSNSYCEGVNRVDYTNTIIGANATEQATGWGVKNMAIRTDKTGWKNPKTDEVDKVVYGITSDYYSTCANTASILKQTLNGLPAGNYVLSMTMMGSTNLPVYVFFNEKLIGEMTAIGIYGGGKYGAGWNDYVIAFTKADDSDMPLQLQCKPEANYKEWYVDNFRLYRLTGDTEGIGEVNVNNVPSNHSVYDLQGRKVNTQLKKGIYIVDGRKVIKR